MAEFDYFEFILCTVLIQTFIKGYNIKNFALYQYYLKCNRNLNFF